MIRRILDEFTRALGWLFPADGDSDGEAVDSFRRSWDQAVRGETHPIAELWLDLETEETDASDEDDAVDDNAGWLDG